MSRTSLSGSSSRSFPVPGPPLFPERRSPGAGPSGHGIPSLFEASGLGAAMQETSLQERSLPPTPRSPSPTCSPPSSPKRQAQKRDDEAAKDGALSAAEEDLETRAAALGLHEIERRVWRETALPPTPSSPSPTFSPPSSPKTNQRQAEALAQQAAVKLAASLRSIPPIPSEGSRSCDSDSDAMAEAEVATAIAAWEAAGGGLQDRSDASRKKRQL